MGLANLTPIQSQGVEDLFGLLEWRQLQSLAHTVSRGKVRVQTRVEAKRCIRLYELDLSRLLERRAISFEVLMYYSNENNIAINGGPPTKASVARSILAHWQ